MTPLTELILGKISDKVIKLIGRRLEATSADVTVDEKSIQRHLIEVRAWCTRIQFFGVSKAQQTAKESVALSFHTTPRRFRGKTGKKDLSSESDLLKQRNNQLLLGDPGSGKTTSLKRLAYHLLTHEIRKGEIPLTFPLVIPCREMDHRKSLVENIAERLGVPVTEASVTHKRHRSSGLLVGDQPITDFVADALNELSPLILIDGIDEAPAKAIAALFEQLKRLARVLDGPKIIATCRSGLYKRSVEGFDVLEIMPLDPGRIDKIARIWLEDPKAFYLALNELPYSDVLDRPLLLTQLLFIFKRQGYLPEQPSDIYIKVVRLLLEDWDTERGVKRGSKYAHFEPERKLAFLAELAFVLTSKIKAKRFNRANLLRAYEQIRHSFGLPSEEADEVASEIESHNGLIVSSGFDHYEFAHLSLQEFLCAYYVVRAPFSDDFLRYMTLYPAPMAVAVSLSSDPSAWLASLVLQCGMDALFSGGWAARAFLKRIILERPYFRPSQAVGFAFLKLLFEADLADEGLFGPTCALPGGRDSIAEALKAYAISSADSDDTFYYLELRENQVIAAFEGSEIIRIRRAMLLDVLRDSACTFLWRNENDEMHIFRLNKLGEPPF
jgi:hypothetical protein